MIKQHIKGKPKPNVYCGDNVLSLKPGTLVMNTAGDIAIVTDSRTLVYLHDGELVAVGPKSIATYTVLPSEDTVELANA